MGPGYRALIQYRRQPIPANAVADSMAMTDDAAQMPDLTGMAFESGAWGNQFDMELMYLLNPRLESLRPRLEEGEGVEIVLPMTMTDQQFTREQWERIDRRVFYAPASSSRRQNPGQSAWRISPSDHRQS